MAPAGGRRCPCRRHGAVAWGGRAVSEPTGQAAAVAQGKTEKRSVCGVGEPPSGFGLCVPGSHCYGILEAAVVFLRLEDIDREQ